MKKVILSQAKIAYLRVGDKKKPKLLMLHGLFTSSTYFKETVKYLKKDFDILVPDFPGFGNSDKLKDLPHNLSTYAKAIIELCDYLKFKPFHLLGSSLGGMTSIILTAKYPSYVQKLVLQAPPWCKECINLDFTRKALTFASKYRHVVKLAGKLKTKVRREMLVAAMKIFNKHFFTIETKSGGIYHSFKTMDLDATSDVWNNIKDVHLLKYIKRIRKPTLLISGDHDEQVKPKRIRELTKFIPNSKFKLVKGWDCTHSLFFDRPKDLAKIVKNFLL